MSAPTGEPAPLARDARSRALPAMPIHLGPASLLTRDLPGIGGRLKDRPEDFLVEEQPLYQPTGQGEHIYLMVQKHNLDTASAARILAKHFQVPMGAVGFAGLKDKVAVTRQVFSIHAPGKKPESFPMLQHPHVQVLWVDLHENKLRRGHLAGNRFSIKVRGVDMTRAVAAKRILDRLAKTGVPNRFGEQRFGYLHRNQEVGRALLVDDPQGVLDAVLAPGPADIDDGQRQARERYLAGDYAGSLSLFSRQARLERLLLQELARGRNAKQALRAMHPVERRFFLDAFQSAVFNDVLTRRLASGSLDKLAEGDIAFKHDSGAVFAVDATVLADPTTTDRLAKQLISPSGPMWGTRMMRAGEPVDAIEIDALQATGVTTEDLTRLAERSRDGLSGERRALRVTITDTEVEGGTDEIGPYVRCAFDLPRGAYATEVMREVMKPATTATLTSEDDEPQQAESDADRR